MVTQTKFLHAVSLLFLSGVLSFTIVHSSLYFNLMILVLIIAGTVLLCILNKGLQFYNEQFVPVVIFFTLGLFILSNNIIELTGNNYVDEVILLQLLIVAFISSINAPLNFIAKIDNKLILYFFAVFIFAGFFSTLINLVPANIAMRGGLLIAKPLIILFVFLLFSMNRVSRNKIYKYIYMFFIGVCLVSVSWTVIFEIILSFNPATGVSLESKRFMGLQVFRSFFRHPGTYSSIMILVSNYFFAVLLFKRRRQDLIFFAIAVLGMVSTFRVKVIILLPVTCTVIWLLFVLKENEGDVRALPIKNIFVAVVGLLLLSAGLYAAKDKLIFYSTEQTVRSAVFLTSFKVSKENYGLGAGFGRYGSAVSTRYYSPLYYKYNLDTLRGASPEKSNFITDQWWAWYIGEAGIIGMLFFLAALFLLSRELAHIARAHHDRDYDLSIIGYTAIGGLIYGFGSGFAMAGLSGPPSSYFILGLTGLTLNLHYISTGSN